MLKLLESTSDVDYFLTDADDIKHLLYIISLLTRKPVEIMPGGDENASYYISGNRTFVITDAEFTEDW